MFRRPCCLHRPDHGSSRHLRNVDTLLYFLVSEYLFFSYLFLWPRSDVSKHKEFKRVIEKLIIYRFIALRDLTWVVCELCLTRDVKVNRISMLNARGIFGACGSSNRSSVRVSLGRLAAWRKKCCISPQNTIHPFDRSSFSRVLYYLHLWLQQFRSSREELGWIKENLTTRRSQIKPMEQSPFEDAGCRWHN